MTKIKIDLICLKWRENWSEMIFGLFRPTAKKNWGGVQKNVVKTEKNQSCSKLPEIARKLVENNFLIFGPPPTNYVQTYYIIPQLAAGEIMTW